MESQYKVCNILNQKASTLMRSTVVHPFNSDVLKGSAVILGVNQ